jgi:hypothetical protein
MSGHQQCVHSAKELSLQLNFSTAHKASAIYTHELGKFALRLRLSGPDSGPCEVSEVAGGGQIEKQTTRGRSNAA